MLIQSYESLCGLFQSLQIPSNSRHSLPNWIISHGRFLRQYAHVHRWWDKCLHKISCLLEAGSEKFQYCPYFRSCFCQCLLGTRRDYATLTHFILSEVSQHDFTVICPSGNKIQDNITRYWKESSFRNQYLPGAWSQHGHRVPEEQESSDRLLTQVILN